MLNQPIKAFFCPGLPGYSGSSLAVTIGAVRRAVSPMAGARASTVGAAKCITSAGRTVFPFGVSETRSGLRNLHEPVSSTGGGGTSLFLFPKLNRMKPKAPDTVGVFSLKKVIRSRVAMPTCHVVSFFTGKKETPNGRFVPNFPPVTTPIESSTHLAGL